MTDSNATERICELLEQSGIDYKLRRASATSARETVFWEYEKDGDWATAEYAITVPQDGYGTLTASRLTPEQAVAATLGAGECENEKLRGQIETLVAYVESDGTKYYVDDEGNQHFDHAATLGAEAIAAWNSRAERTCKPLGTIRYDYEGGYAGFEYETELSCGHKWRDAYGDYPDYCPSCGCKVVGE